MAAIPMSPKAAVDSKFRNTYGVAWKKEKGWSNLKTLTSDSATLLVTNGRLFAVPWTSAGDGRVCVTSMDTYGKVADAPSLICAHRESILDLQFDPFDESILATASRDGTAKLWRIPPMTEKWSRSLTPDDALVTLPHPKRVTGLACHPHIAGLTLTTSGDNIIRLWDWSQPSPATGATPVTQLPEHPDVVQSVAWDEEHGRLFVTACKDMRMRVVDIRQPQQQTTGMGTKATEVSKGFRARFAEGRNGLISVGFSKGGARQLLIWDTRKLSSDSSQPMATITVDDLPAPLMPFYDSGTGLLWLGGRGTTLPYYEVFGQSPWTVSLGSFSSPLNRLAMAQIPKRYCDVMKCEVGRFLVLGSSGATVDQLSFHVPRKNTSSVFHEDLFPAVPSGLPSAGCTAKDWVEGKVVESKAAVISLQPEGVASIFDVPVEEGGKSRDFEEEKQSVAAGGVALAPLIDHGALKLEEEGWIFTGFSERYVAIKRNQLYVFENAESAASLLAISCFDITGCGAVDATKFTVSTAAKVYVFEATDSVTKESWIRSIQKITESIKRTLETPTSQPLPSPSPLTTLVSSPPPPPSPAPPPSSAASPMPQKMRWDCEGKLTEYIGSGGMLSRSVAKKRYFLIGGGVLYSQPLSWWYEEPTGDPQELCHIEKIINISSTTTVSSSSSSTGGGATVNEFGFAVSTPNRVFNLAAETEEERNKWITQLQRVHKECSAFLSTTTTPRSSLLAPPTTHNRSKTMFVMPSAPSPPPPSMMDEEDETKEEDEEYSVEEESEELEEVRLEGLITVFWGIGALGYWSTNYLTVYADEMFFFKTSTSSIPWQRVPLLKVSAFRTTDTDNPNFHDTDFEATLKDNNGTMYFRAKDLNDRTKWMTGLEQKRKLSIDILKQLGIITADQQQPPAAAAEDKQQVVISDMTVVANGHKKLLMQVVGKRRVRVWNAELSVAALNPCNSFVLDAGQTLYVWNGCKASRICKAKAVDLAQRIKAKERAARSTIVVLDQGKGDLEAPLFWQCLEGGAKGQQVRSVDQVASAEEQDRIEDVMKVYRIRMNSNGNSSENKNKKRVQVVWESVELPSRRILHCNNVYVVEAPTIMFVWVGKLTDLEQRKLGITVAKKLFTQQPTAVTATIIRVLQGAEPNIFKEMFCDFPGMLPIHTGTIDQSNKVANTRPQKPVAELVAMMYKEPSRRQEKLIPDEECNGTLRIYRVEEFGKVEYPEQMYGQFFSAESFMILYSFKLQNSGRDSHVIYFYQGRDSTISDRGAAAFFAIEQAECLKGEFSIQVRIVQYKETEHFMRLFNHGTRCYVVHKGKYENHKPQQQSGAAFVYDVRGSSVNWCRAVETTTSALPTLHPLHCSVVVTSGHVFVWHGNQSSAEEQAAALKCATLLKGETSALTVLTQGSEASSLFHSLVTAPPPNVPHSRFPKLFVCSQGSGAVEIEEELQPCQDDLVDRGVFIVDAFSVIYVWIGLQALPLEKKIGMEAAQQYLAQSPFGHDTKSGVPVVAVVPFHEPVEFRMCFQGWSKTKQRVPKGVNEEEVGPVKPVTELLKEFTRSSYTFDELLQDPLPEGIDPTKLETYLSPEEFQQVFHMTQTEFAAQKKWNQDQLKRDVGLF